MAEGKVFPACGLTIGIEPKLTTSSPWIVDSLNTQPKILYLFGTIFLTIINLQSLADYPIGGNNQMTFGLI